MRAVLQRVSRASVGVAGTVIAAIDRGILVLIGIADGDGPDDIAWLSGKIARLRIFTDDEGLMNRSVVDVGGGLLVVSQFTLLASTAKGNRPSFTGAARPEAALPLYQSFCERLSADCGAPVAVGRFGADMRVESINDGPVTILIDSRARE